MAPPWAPCSCRRRGGRRVQALRPRRERGPHLHHLPSVDQRRARMTPFKGRGASRRQTQVRGREWPHSVSERKASGVGPAAHATRHTPADHLPLTLTLAAGTIDSDEGVLGDSKRARINGRIFGVLHVYTYRPWCGGETWSARHEPRLHVASRPGDVRAVLATRNWARNNRDERRPTSQHPAHPSGRRHLDGAPPAC